MFQCNCPLATQKDYLQACYKKLQYVPSNHSQWCIVQETSFFHGVQRGSLITGLSIIEDLLPKKQHNNPNKKCMPPFSNFELLCIKFLAYTPINSLTLF